MVKGAAKDPSDTRRQIFDEHVCIGMDNLFSRDEILKFLGEGGWKATMTCRCDRLPKGIPKKHFHYVKGATVNVRSKVPRFEQPIVAVKHVKQLLPPRNSDDQNIPTPSSDLKDYVLTHASFQSTGGTNISLVNALSTVDLYVRE
jgi:hypothetical protein